MTTVKIDTREVISPFDGEILTVESKEGLIDTFAMAMNVCNLVANLLIDVDDTDTQISFVELLKEQYDHNWTQKATVAQKLADKTIGDTKTRRVAGENRVCKVEMPSETWDSKTLKYLWETQPGQAKKFLRIAAIDPMLREVKKLETMSCEGELRTFRDVLLAAKRPASGTPRITVEK